MKADYERGDISRWDEYYRIQQEGVLSLSTSHRPVVAQYKGRVSGSMAAFINSCTIPVVSESAYLYFPHVQYGLNPMDAGFSYKWHREHKPSLGAFMALTGEPICGADLLHMGFAKFFITDDNLQMIEKTLTLNQKQHWSIVLAHLMRVQEHVADPMFERVSGSVANNCFNESRVEDVMAKLDQLDDNRRDYGHHLMLKMRRASPLALKVALRCLQYGAIMSLEDALQMEYNATTRLLRHPDVYEGISAFADQRLPKWSYRNFESVPDEEVDAYFEPTTPGYELEFKRINRTFAPPWGHTFKIIPKTMSYWDDIWDMTEFVDSIGGPAMSMKDIEKVRDLFFALPDFADRIDQIREHQFAIRNVWHTMQNELLEQNKSTSLN